MSSKVQESPSSGRLDKPEKRHKKHKDQEKKRRREEKEDESTTRRKHKRSKSEAAEAFQPSAPATETVVDVNGSSKPKKYKKSKHPKNEVGEAPEEGKEVTPRVDEASVKKHKKDKKYKMKNEPNGIDPSPADSVAAAVDAVEDGPSLRKSKSKLKKQKDRASGDDVGDAAAEISEEQAEKEKKKSKKEKKEKESKSMGDKQIEEDAEETQPATTNGDAQVEVLSTSDQPAKKRKKRARRKSKHAKEGEEGIEVSAGKTDPPTEEEDRMDVDTSPQPKRKPSPESILQPPDAPRDPAFSFMTQNVSLYVPLYPVGFDQPLTKVAEQHLKPLLNHYSPLLKGVLLDYRNVSLGERPKRVDPRNPPMDRSPAVLASVDEYAVGFGWLTAEVYLFVPRRGAWMEGIVNLQSEGHLGVVCWDRFNASIEARRVPRDWKFIDIVQRAEDAKKAKFRNAGKAAGRGDSTAPSAPEPTEEEQEQADQDNLDSLQQMHATGYWVDGKGRRVEGKLRFRINNFDVGTAGDHGYISIEGTMLSDEEEKSLVAREKEREQKRKSRGGFGMVNGILVRETRGVPEFSMTNFGKEDEEQINSKKQPVYIGSRPGTPDD